MPYEYLPIAVLMIIAIVLACLILFLSYFMGPKSPTSRKSIPYESGIRPLTSARQRFPVKFYLVAMLFIVFDVENIFFYTWAVTFRQLGLFGLIEMLLFILTLLIGYIYIIRKGALDWD